MVSETLPGHSGSYSALSPQEPEGILMSLTLYVLLSWKFAELLVTPERRQIKNTVSIAATAWTMAASKKEMAGLSWVLQR